jgi:opacity protein-like surface antigen
MKKLLLSLVVAGLAGGAAAHGNNGPKMGDLVLYGNGGFSLSKGTTENKFGTANKYSIDDPKVKMWTISPGIGFNITDCITVGVDIRYQGSKVVYDKKTIGSFPAVSETRSYDLGVGPFVRCSWPIGEHFFAYGQLTAHYMRGRDTRVTSTAPVGGNSYSADDTYRGVHVGYMPAVGINVCRNVALTFALGGVDYTYTKTDFSTQGLPAGSDVTAKNHDFAVNIGREIQIGVQKTLGCGRKVRGNKEPMDETRQLDTNDDDDSSNKKKHHRHGDDE